MARLVVDSGPDEGMIFPLSESVTTLGRSPSNSIQVSDRRASRFHGEIVRRGAQFELRDLESKNGITVQGKRVEGEHLLHHGDQIRIGQTEFVFEDDRQDTTTPSVSSAAASGIRLADQADAQMQGSVPAGITRAIEAAAVDSEIDSPAAVTETHKRLDVLLQVLDKVRSVLDLDQLLNELMDLVFEVLEPERGLIMLIDPKSGALVPRVIKTSEDAEEIAISRSIVHQVIRERMALLISDAKSDERFQGNESIVAQQILSAICAPLSDKEEVFGVLYIDSRCGQGKYGQKELELLTGIADQAALAVSNALLHKNLVEQNRLEQELEIARSIQMNLLPKQAPIVPGFDLAAMTLPAKRVGGDYYDFIQIDSDHLGIAVADVSGKGVPAAILTASMRAALQVEARRSENQLGDIIRNLNEMACRDAADNMFVAVFFGILQLSSRRFRYINAGHCYPFFRERDGTESELDIGGCVLGVLPDREFKQGEVRLTPGSTMIIYSDGVTDIQNEQGEHFGFEPVRKMVGENAEITAEQLRQKIFDMTNEYKGSADQFDDYTLVIIKAL